MQASHTRLCAGLVQLAQKCARVDVEHTAETAEREGLDADTHARIRHEPARVPGEEEPCAEHARQVDKGNLVVI